MLNKIEIMLYVENVQECADFWKKAFNSEEVEREVMPDESLSIRLNILDNVGIRFFNKEFIKKFSPEVSLSVPSLMLYTSDIEKIHNNISELGSFVSPIEEFMGRRQFNFSDHENNYFAVSEI